MKTLKRALCLLLTLTMLVGMFTMVASASSGAVYTINLDYNYPNGTEYVYTTSAFGPYSLANDTALANMGGNGWEVSGWVNVANGATYAPDATEDFTEFAATNNGVVELQATWTETTPSGSTTTPGGSTTTPGGSTTTPPTLVEGEVGTFVVTLQYNNCEADGRIMMEYTVYNGTKLGSAVSNLPTPERAGYKFLGWYINGVEYNGEVLTEDCTMTAEWEAITTPGYKPFPNYKPGYTCYNCYGYGCKYCKVYTCYNCYGYGCKYCNVYTYGCNHSHYGTHTIRYTDGVPGQTIFRDQTYTARHNDYTPKFYGTPVRAGYRFLGWTPSVATRATSCVTYTAVWGKAYTVAPTLTTQHIAYIFGDPDGEVRPMDKITRAEVAAILYRLLSDRTLNEYQSNTNPFTDVDVDDWYNTAVSTLYNAGIISGNGQYFKPEEAITRAEIVTMLSRFSTQTWNGQCNFRDVTKYDWFFEEIGLAAQIKLITGDEYGFRPNDSVLRCEAVTMINRALGRDYCRKNFIDYTKWVDNPVGTWYYAEMVEAGNSH